MPDTPTPDWQNKLRAVLEGIPKATQSAMGYGPWLEGKVMDYIFPSKQPLVQPQTAMNAVTGLTSGGVETPGSTTYDVQRYLADQISAMTKGPNMAYMAAGLMGGMGAPRPGPTGITPQLLETPKAAISAEEQAHNALRDRLFGPMGIIDPGAVQTWVDIEAGKDLLKGLTPEAEANLPQIPDAVLEKLKRRVKYKKDEGFFDETPPP